MTVIKVKKQKRLRVVEEELCVHLLSVHARIPNLCSSKQALTSHQITGNKSYCKNFSVLHNNNFHVFHFFLVFHMIFQIQKVFRSKKVEKIALMYT